MAVNLDHAQLDMPAATVTRAMENLVPANPLYDMLCTHLHLLTRTTAAAPLLLDHLECATVRLARVLVASAADDEARHREALECSLPARLRLYIESNLTDPSLSPAGASTALSERISRFDSATRRHDFTRLAVAAGIDRPIDRLPAVRRGEKTGAACVFVPGKAESPPTWLGGFR
ncbi:hypothetical protein R1CP_01180 [Rhodococcus opacus]|uniref:Uncharacterized protein n=1 Tax=Rhodococcus opacus TaxID=37919 RepID=A0A1B1JXA6_RHOOP|nr:hypothetical protein [Rhodococcus opacus]ANS24989.1 hypothetical protein R1CP_01180 [Rhodococcus opacus]